MLQEHSPDVSASAAAPAAMRRYPEVTNKACIANATLSCLLRNAGRAVLITASTADDSTIARPIDFSLSKFGLQPSRRCDEERTTLKCNQFILQSLGAHRPPRLILKRRKAAMRCVAHRGNTEESAMVRGKVGLVELLPAPKLDSVDDVAHDVKTRRCSNVTRRQI